MSDDQTTPRRAGRPRKNRGVATFYKSDLYLMLRDKFPQFRNGEHLKVRDLAKAIPVSYQAMYRWLDQGRLSRGAAQSLVDLSQGRLTKEEVVKFVLG